MARLWSSGFELQSVTAAMEFTAVVGSPTISTSVKRSGAASLRINPSATTQAARMTFQADTINTTFHRFYIYIASATIANGKAIYTYQDSASGNGWSVRMDTNRSLVLYNEAGANQVGSNSSALALNTWYCIEVRYVDSAGATAELSCRIDGAAAFASSTTETGINGGGQVRIGAAVTQTCDLYFDDIAINDSTGSYQNSWPGEGSIVHLQPNAAGDNNGWLKSGGGAGSSTNYQDVDEVTPDGATTYLKRTAAGSVIDDYNVVSSASAGIGSSDTISLVSVGQRAGAISTTATNRSNKLRIKSASGGTTTSTSAIDISVPNWLTHVDGSPKIYQLNSYIDPTTGVAWTPTGTNSLDNMQIGFENGTSSATEIRVSTVWALVEYVPYVGSGTSVTPGVGAMVLTGYAPTVNVSTTTTLTPGVATALALTSFTPTVRVGTRLTPGVATQLTLTSFTPTVRVGTRLTPGTATPLVLTSFTPTVNYTYTTTLTPGVATPMVLTSYAPTIVIGLALTPAPATPLTLTSYVPSVIISSPVFLYPAPADQMVLTSYPPELIIWTPAQHVLIWTGTEWRRSTTKQWNGSTWVDKPLKAWTGSVWK